MENVKQALTTESDFVINLVNDTLDKIYLEYKFNNSDKFKVVESFFNGLAETMIKRFIKLFPNLNQDLLAKAYRTDKRVHLQESVNNLTSTQVTELVDSLHSHGFKKFLFEVLHFATLGLLDKAVKATYSWLFDCDLNNLSSEQEIQFTRVLAYLTLLLQD
jgi:hypothetical protein